MDLMRKLFEAEQIQYELEAELAAIKEEIGLIKLLMDVLSADQE